jgi:hypothetical protein
MISMGMVLPDEALLDLLQLNIGFFRAYLEFAVFA